jgi:hypothetical protein
MRAHAFRRVIALFLGQMRAGGYQRGFISRKDKEKP